MIIPDHCLGLQGVNELVNLLKMPVGAEPLPFSVEPDAGNLAIIRQQFCELRFHKTDIVIPVRLSGSAIHDRPAEAIVIPSPVKQRIIKK